MAERFYVIEELHRLKYPARRILYCPERETAVFEINDDFLSKSII